MHGQHDPRVDLFDHGPGVRLADGERAIHADHQHVDPAKCVQIGRLEQMMQMTEMGDAQPGGFEDKNGSYGVSC